MRRRDFIQVIAGSVITSPLSARAQQPDRVRRVGVLHVIPEQASLGFTAFRKKLGELGYVEGQNIAFEYRWSDQAQRLPALAAELTGSKVDVIVTADTTAALVAKQATKDIPIVAATLTEDPVATGLVPRAHGQRPSRRRAAEQHDEVAPSQMVERHLPLPIPGLVCILLENQRRVSGFETRAWRPMRVRYWHSPVVRRSSV
jgi:putative tryptophan/tyrosine transport system substrate-binding protein